MGKNLLSVNLKYYKAGEINRISDHNNRISKIDYLLEKENILFNNVDVIYKHFNDETNINNKYLFNTGEYENQKDQINEYNLKNKNNGDLLKFETLNLLQRKRLIQAKNKSYTKKSENEIIEMVIALSEDQAKEYLNNGIDLTKGFDKFALNLQETYGFTPIGLSFHLDEGYVAAHDDIENNIKKGDVKYNIHAHLVVLNYDFDRERSVLRNMKKQDMRDLQDLCEKSFQSVNLDFKRGVSKKISGKNHLEKNDFILEKQEKNIEFNNTIINNQSQNIQNLNIKLSGLSSDIQKLETIINKKKKDYYVLDKYITIKKQEILTMKDDITKVNTIKNEYKLLLENYEKGSEEYQALYNTIGKYQEKEKELRSALKSLKVELDNNYGQKDAIIENIEKLNKELKTKENELLAKSKIILEKALNLRDLDNNIVNKSKDLEDLETKIVEKKEIVVENYDEFDKYLQNEVNKNINPLIEKSMVGSGSIKNIPKLKENILKMAKTFSESDVVISKYQNDRLELIDSRAKITNLENEKKALVKKNDNYDVQVKFFRGNNTELNDSIKGKDKIISDKNMAILEYEKTEKALKRFLIKHNISFDDFISFKQKHIGD